MRMQIFLRLLVSFLIIQGYVLADTIELVDGKKLLKIQIVEETIDKVVYKKAGLPNQSIPTEKVEQVIFHSTANEFKIANEAYRNSDWGPAANLFNECAETLEGGNEALRGHCLYRAAECFQKSGNWKDAISTFTRFANAFPNHRLYADSLLNRAICYLNNQELSKASEAFSALESQVGKKNLGERWKYEVSYWNTYLAEKDNPSKALKDYQAIYDQTAGSYPDVATKASLRIGQVMVAQKRYDDANTFFTKIIESRMDSDRAAAAGAYLGRGRCILNKKNATKEDYKQALFDLLRVVVHYSNVGEYQAEAKYWAGKCFQLLGEKDSAKRWQTLFRSLQREWPGSPWAEKASKELGF